MAGWTIRPLTPLEAGLVPEVERDAAARFRAVDLAEIADGDVSSAAFVEAVIRSGVALGAFDGDRLAGFALAGVLDDALHLYELSVATADGGRGIGTALLAALETEAARRGLAAVTLSTFVDVPWNGPFYLRRGFRVLAPADFPPAAYLVHNAERAAGLPLERRVFMRKDIVS